MQPRTVDLLAGFSPEARASAAALRASGELAARLAERYPGRHEIQGNAALNDYVQALKREHLRTAPPVARVRYVDKLSVLHDAFGLHTRAARVQGALLTTRREISVCGLFKELAPEFLRMVVVHELAHLRHFDHDKAFYRLCEHIEPDYLRLEVDLRLWLYCREGGPRGG